MDGWVIGIIVAAVQTVITTIAGLLVKAKWDKEKKEKEELEQLREEKRAASEGQRCQAVKTAVHEEVAVLSEKVDADMREIKDNMDVMKKAMQKDIRRSLRQDGAKMIKRGYASQLEKTEFDELYWSYHNLGKNGVVDSLHKQVMELPEEPPVEQGE